MNQTSNKSQIPILKFKQWVWNLSINELEVI